MRIGVLTFHKSINNGAVMQCYSLCKRLAKEFPQATVEVINYHMPKIEETYAGGFKSYIQHGNWLIKVKKFILFLKHPMVLQKQKKKKKVFEEELHQLPLSDRYIFENDTKNLYQYINDRYDVIVVGSDAVWNYTTRGFPNAYFPNQELKIPKFSYAASCYGMDFLECVQDKSRIRESLGSFEFLGVRDKATEEFVLWSGCEKRAVHTCDPTAFLDVNELPIDVNDLKEILRKRGFNFEKPAIGIMGNEKMLKMVRSFYGEKYQLVALFNYIPGADVQLYDITPYQWAYVFRYFKLTFTTYFHGTMLSLRNGVPVICVALDTPFSQKHTPKTLDVLERLGFSEWYFHTDYKSVNVNAIRAKADQLLDQQVRDCILSRIEHEAQSFNGFMDVFKKVLKNLLKREENNCD